MKIRTGFVSNSSTSSFVIYGIELSEEIREKLISYCKSHRDEMPEGVIYPQWNDETKEKCDPYEYVTDEKGLNLDWCEDCDGEKGGIGICIVESDSDSGFMEYNVLYPESHLSQFQKLLEITGKTKDDLCIVAGTKEC